MAEFAAPDAPKFERVPYEIKSPVSGRVLRLFGESSRVVTFGTPLVEVGDPLDLEVTIEVLSRDGAAILPGAKVEFDQWGGGKPLLGRVRLTEPAADLTIALSIASSFRDRPVADDLAVIGEVGLSGELRTISQVERRLKEASKLGFKRALAPQTVVSPKFKFEGTEAIGVKNVSEAIEVAVVR